MHHVRAVLLLPFGFGLAIQVKSRLEAENAVLRHQLIVLRLKVPGRVRLTNNDRRFLIQLYRWFPSILQVPATLVRWHRPAFVFLVHTARITTSVITQPLRAFLRRTLWAARAGREVDRHFAPRPTIA